MKFLISLGLVVGCTTLAVAQKTAKPAPAANPQLTKDKTLSAKGDADAMYNMGLHYLKGDGVPRDAAKAVSWFTKSAQKGNVPSMLQLGMLYEESDGAVKQDMTKAIEWLKKAAGKGSLPAINELGTIYEDGVGVKADRKEAIKYYELAANQGNVDAMLGVATAYIDGEGIERNTELGYQWLTKAAVKDNVIAMRYLGDYFSDSTMGNSCNKAIEWYMKAADHGDTASIMPIGEITIMDGCPTADMSAVVQWVQALADKSNPLACYFMARFYIDGKGVTQSFGKAMDYFVKDAEISMEHGIKYSSAIKNLFVLYDMGKLSETRQQKLITWLQNAANNTQDADIMAGLGYIYTNKENATDADYKKAMDWSMKSAAKGNATGCYNVGYMYANGLGVNRNDAKAFEWMQKAASKGDKAAMAALSDFYEAGVGTTANHTKALEWKAKSKEGGKDEE